MFKIEYHYSHRDPWLISFLLKTVLEIFLLLHVKLIELYRLISFRLKEEHKLDSLTRPAHLCYPRLTCLSPKLSTNEKKKKKKALKIVDTLGHRVECIWDDIQTSNLQNWRFFLERDTCDTSMIRPLPFPFRAPSGWCPCRLGQTYAR